MPNLSPLNFKKWIEENRHLLKPPVGNQQIWADREFMVTVVGGPNSRNDFHINEGEEFFYQIEGSIVLEIMEHAPKDSPSRLVKRSISIAEGEIFLLPAGVPHSPQRPANSVGLVIERRRREHERDRFVWYCPECSETLYEEGFHLTDIVKQLPPVFARFNSNPLNSVCKKCGAQLPKSGPTS